MNLFVYGTLRDPIIASRVVGREVSSYIPARLTGYKIGNWGRYLILYPSDDSSNEVLGEVITDLAEEDMERLDMYEGIPRSPYKRINVTVKTADSEMDCFAYADA